MVDSRTFTLCLGNDGGYFQLGGYTTENFLSEQIILPFSSRSGGDFYINMNGVSINDHRISGSEKVD